MSRLDLSEITSFRYDDEMIPSFSRRHEYAEGFTPYFKRASVSAVTLPGGVRCLASLANNRKAARGTIRKNCKHCERRRRENPLMKLQAWWKRANSELLVLLVLLVTPAALTNLPLHSSNTLENLSQLSELHAGAPRRAATSRAKTLHTNGLLSWK